MICSNNMTHQIYVQFIGHPSSFFELKTEAEADRLFLEIVNSESKLTCGGSVTRYINNEEVERYKWNPRK